MPTFDTIHPWVPAVIFCAVGLELVILTLVCIFCRKKPYEQVLDENASLLVGSYKHSEETPKFNADHANMTLQYYLRGLPRMEFVEAYQSTSANSDVYWFMVRDKDLAKIKNKDRYLPFSSGNCVAKVKPLPKLSDFVKNCNVLDTALDVLLTIKDETCPYIFPVFDVKYFGDRDSLIIINEYNSKGSLRDKLLGVKPFHHLVRNYGTSKISYGKPLSTENIFTYTKQILMALIFLDQIHYPLKKTHLWLHAGNLMIDGKFCKISGYEVELLKLNSRNRVASNDDRAGLVAIGQIIFEMASGFPVNYTESTGLDPSNKKYALRRKEKLREIHFEYLKIISPPEVVQLLQFLSDEDKCTSLQVSIHHPFFDQLDKFQLVAPENATSRSLETLFRNLAVSDQSDKRKKDKSLARRWYGADSSV